MLIKSKKYANLILACLVSVFVFSACVSEFVIPPEPVIVEPPDEGFSFQDDIIPIFTNTGCNVSGCHAAGHPVLDLSPANAYTSIQDKGVVDTANPAQSILYTKAAPTSSHFGKYSPQDHAIILQWITDGAKNN